MAILLNINGETRHFHGDPRTPLVDVLRDNMRMTGTKSVCRGGFCGACMVMINGAPIPSCQRPVGLLGDAEIVTIEGISSPNELNAIQRVFVEHDVVQCGMCFPGMVVTLTDFLRHNPMPSRDEVKAALSGNICRCTGYERIIDAIISLSGAQGSSAKDVLQ